MKIFNDTWVGFTDTIVEGLTDVLVGGFTDIMPD